MRRTVLPIAMGSVACAGPPPESPKAPTEAKAITDVERYLPLQDGTVYAYDTVSEDTGATGILTMLVTRPRPGRVDLKIGNRTQRLELGPDGIRHTAGGFVLKAPLRVGAQWKGQAGSASVIRTDIIAEVPAGKFVGCVEVLEEVSSPEASKSITTVFCPDVGIVSLSVEAVSDAEYAKERAVLRSFGPRVDLESAPPPEP